MATTTLNAYLRRLTRGMAAEALMDRSDRELVERFLVANDEVFFDALVRRHGPMVYRVCWRVLQHAQDCEDAFQSTFLLLAQKLKTVKNRDSLASWLHGVAYRVALKAQAQAAKRRCHERQASKAYVGPPDEIEWRELRTVLDAELAQLPEKLRLPLILCYLEARTQDEAASQLGWSKSTLLRRLDEAQTTLVRRLARKGFGLSVPLSAVLLSDCAVSATLPTRLIALTCEAAWSVSSGKAAAAGLVSAKVASLTQGVLNSMFLNKIITGIAAMLLAGLLTGAGILVYQPLRGNTQAQETRAARAAVQDPRPGAAAPRPVWRERARLRGHRDQVSAIAISPDGKLLASGGRDTDVILWDGGTEKVKATLRGHKQPISCVAFSPDGMLLASGSCDVSEFAGEVRLWDVATGKERAVFKLGEAGGKVSSIAFSPDGKLLAAGGDLGRIDATIVTAGAVTLWELASGKERITFKQDDTKVPCGSIAFSPNGKLLALASPNKVKVHDLASQKLVLTLQVSDDGLPAGITPEFRGVAFSPDGKTLATAHNRIGIKLWDAQTGKERITLVKPEGAGWFVGRSLVFSRDGKTLVTFHDQHQLRDGAHVFSGEINQWDTFSGKLGQRLPAQTGLSSIAMSSDGKTLAAGLMGPVGEKGVVQVWELAD